MPVPTTWCSPLTLALASTLPSSLWLRSAQCQAASSSCQHSLYALLLIACMHCFQNIEVQSLQCTGIDAIPHIMCVKTNGQVCTVLSVSMLLLSYSCNMVNSRMLLHICLVLLEVRASLTMHWAGARNDKLTGCACIRV